MTDIYPKTGDLVELWFFSSHRIDTITDVRITDDGDTEVRTITTSRWFRSQERFESMKAQARLDEGKYGVPYTSWKKYDKTCSCGKEAEMHCR